MADGAIALIDSGIGGLSLLKKATKVFPNEDFLYFGDNLNAPYGNRTVNDLKSLAFNNLSYISSFNPKLVILACNTLSLTALCEMRPLFGFPILGVFPPVLSCLLKGGKTLLLSTDRTAEKYAGITNLRAVGLSKLVKDIERHATDINSLDILRYLPKDAVCYDSVILGCTHFLFVKNKIIDHLKPRFICDGGDFTILKARKYLQNTKTIGNYKGYTITFIGDNADYNKSIWDNCGFYL